MKRLGGILLASALMFNLWPVPILRATTQDLICNDALKRVDPGCANADKGEFVSSVLNSMSFVLGAVSVLVLVIAGITMVFAGSNPDTAKRARQAILYAVIGLVVAILAQAIVRFILTRVG